MIIIIGDLASAIEFRIVIGVDIVIVVDAAVIVAQVRTFVN